MSNQIFDEKNPFYSFYQFINGSGTSVFTVTPANNGPLRIDRILAYNDDTIDHNLIVQTQQSGNNATFAIVKIPALSGLDPLPPFDVLTPLLPATMDGLILPTQVCLLLSMSVALTAGKNCFVSIWGGWL